MAAYNDMNITADHLLQETSKVLVNRNRNRASTPDRLMPLIITVFNDLTGRNLSVGEGFLFMMILKMSRITGGKGSNAIQRYCRDDYIDLCGYAALMAEHLEAELEDNC